MTYDLTTLRSVTDQELIERHDKLAESTVPGTRYYLEELARRDQERITTTVVQFTRRIVHLTRAITSLTLVNMVLTAIVAMTVSYT